MARTRRTYAIALIAMNLAGVLHSQQLPVLGDPPTASNSSPAPSKNIRQAAAAQTAPNWYDTSNRTAMRDNWNLIFWPSGVVPTGWTGDVAGNIPGTTTQAFKNAVAARIDWFRAMAGVPVGIGLDPVLSAKDQQAALLFSANRMISHMPPNTWIDWTPEAYEAASHSNICIGFPDDPGCILAYVTDFGSNNYYVGHRRWILYPQTQTMGTGDVPESGPAANPYPAANALWILDGLYGSPRPATRDGYVAWPPTGFVPYQTVWPRWSFSYPGANFTGAAVSMTRAGQSIPVALSTLATGYGEDTLVWVPDNLDPDIYLPPSPPASDTTYTVHITTVVIGGVPQTFDYTVILFDPDAPPAGSSIAFQSTSQTVPAGAITGTASLIVTPFNTTWTVRSSASWLVITTAVSGTGSASIGWSAAANPNSFPRTATITVSGATFTVHQDAVACVYTLTPPSATLPYAGGSGTLVVTSVPQNCPLPNYSYNPSVLTTGSSGSPGRLQIDYTAGQNPAQISRVLTITTAGQTFSITQAGTASLVTVTTNPAGLNVEIDGVAMSAPQSPTWAATDTHTLNAPSPQTAAGTRLAFQDWSDNGAQSHTVSTPASGTIYTASFAATDYLLTRTISPAGGGTLVTNPASTDGYYPPGTPLQLSATAAPGYHFTLFTGDLAGVSNPQTVSMVAPRSVTANFVTIPAGFTDVSPADFFYDAVNLMKARAITGGCSLAPLEYCPNDNVTRAKMAIFIVRAALGGDTFSYSTTPYFNDVQASAFGFAWIQKMFELGITAGCGGGNYCPNDAVTRGQVAIFVTRMRLGSAADSTFTYPPAPFFADVPSTYPFFRWIQRMKVDSITAGCGNGTTYCPDELVTRGQMAIFLMRGAFNYLLPAGQPVISSVTPSAGGRGKSLIVTITGDATHFTSGAPLVSAGPGVTVMNVVATQDTVLTVQLTIDANAVAGPRTVQVTTGNEEAIQPNGFQIQD